MKYTTYDPITGQILSTIEVINDQAFQDNLSNKHFIEGSFTDLTHYIDVDTKTIIVKTAPPSNQYLWNPATKSWDYDITNAITVEREKRNQLLLSIDRVNPIWYNSLTIEQQQELVTYRQQLLDVPQQSDFPVNIIWPSKPTWL